MMFYQVKEESQNDMPCSVVKVSDFFFFFKKNVQRKTPWALKKGPDSGQGKLQNKTTATLPVRSALNTSKTNVTGVPRRDK